MNMVNHIETLRRESVDLFNRLHSIDEDATFVSAVADEYAAFPLVPNLRCGAWYTDPNKTMGHSVYFKSTDGHHGQWSFNLRRANLHLLQVVMKHDGVFIVDSTRRGKRIPDALAKTIPLWCAVVNAAVCKRHPEANWLMPEHSELFTPPASVSASEHAQMTALVDKYANNLLNSEYQLPCLAKPLRPFWITPSTTVLPARSNSSQPFFPVICVSASKMVPDGLDRRQGYTYVQGSGDDHELWSQGLTPDLYWKNRLAILAVDRDTIDELVSRLISKSSSSPSSSMSAPAFIDRVDRLLCITTLDAWTRHLQGHSSRDAVVIRLVAAPDMPLTPTPQESTTETSLPTECTPNELVLPIISGKRGQHHFMHNILPHACAFAQHQLRRDNPGSVYVVSDDMDNAVGAALAILQLCFDDSGDVRTTAESSITKQSIRRRLQWILEATSGANPSRTTLKRVNEFLMSANANAAKNVVLSSGGP